MPRKKPITLYAHCYQELLDERIKDLRAGKDVSAIGEAIVAQRVVEYARRTPFVPPPRTRKRKRKMVESPPASLDYETVERKSLTGDNMVYEKGKLVHG